MVINLNYTIEQFRNRNGYVYDRIGGTNGGSIDYRGHLGYDTLISLISQGAVPVTVIRESDGITLRIGDTVYIAGGNTITYTIVSFLYSGTSVNILLSNNTVYSLAGVLTVNQYQARQVEAQRQTARNNTPPVAPTPTTQNTANPTRGRRTTTQPAPAQQTVAPVTNTTNNIEQLEARIISQYPRAIRFERTAKTRREDLATFLENFFTTHNENKATVYADVPEGTTGRVQTEAGKRRSLGDIFMICKYYYPNCTLEDVLSALYYDLPDSLDGFRTSYCTVINKRVWYLDEDQDTAVHDTARNDEYGHRYNWYTQQLETADVAG